MIEKRQHTELSTSSGLATYFGSDHLRFGDILDVEMGKFHESIRVAMQSLSKLVAIEGIITSEDAKLAHNKLMQVIKLDTNWVITKTMLDLMITIDHWVTIPQPPPFRIHMTKFGERWVDLQYEIVHCIADAHHLQVDRQSVHGWNPEANKQLQANRQCHGKSKRGKLISLRQQDRSKVLWDKYELCNIE